MRYRRFGRTEISVSVVSLGGAYLMGSEPARAAANAAAVVAQAAALGINYVDTAPLYGDSELLLGSTLEACGATFHVATKVGLHPPEFDYRADSVLASLERSLARLRRPWLDVAQIHEVNKAGWGRIMAAGGTLAGLRAAQRRGLCRYVGITGRAIPLLARLAATGEFDTVLVYHDYHPCSQLAAQAVLPAAAAADMGVVVATVLAGGLFVPGEPQQRALARLAAPDRQRATAVLAGLERLGAPLPQSACRWVLGDARVHTVCSGAATPRELVQVAAAADLPPLSPR